ncbi:MAG: hypothetical protein WCF12_01150, partial [Propionicimonas sp.]
PTTERPPWAWLKLTLAVALPLVLIAAGIGLWYSYTRTQYFVGPHGETVAIFRGVPPDQVFGMPLSELVESTSTRLDDLPASDRAEVIATMHADSLASARVIADNLEARSLECLAQRRTRLQPTVTPLPSATTAASPSPKASPKASPKGSPTPSPTPKGSPSSTVTPQPSTSTPSIDTTGC